MGKRPSEEEMKRRRQPLIRLLAERIVESHLIEIGELPPRAAPEPAKRRISRPRPIVDWTQTTLAAFQRCMLSVDDILARKQPLADVERIPHLEGVYFLIAESSIMYVGSSSDLRERMNQHRGRPCTHFAWIEAPRFYLDLEAHYVNLLLPPWNSRPAPAYSEAIKQIVHPRRR